MNNIYIYIYIYIIYYMTAQYVVHIHIYLTHNTYIAHTSPMSRTHAHTYRTRALKTRPRDEYMTLRDVEIVYTD